MTGTRNVEMPCVSQMLGLSSSFRRYHAHRKRIARATFSPLKDLCHHFRIVISQFSLANFWSFSSHEHCSFMRLENWCDKSTVCRYNEREYGRIGCCSVPTTHTLLSQYEQWTSSWMANILAMRSNHQENILEESPFGLAWRIYETLLVSIGFCA